jgi:putative nucleotidyltransferase with HDIG domain
MGGLLHDIGKAVDHEVEGPHAAIGAQIAQRHNLPFKVINGIAAHHQEVEYACLEAPIVQIADAISASRPGARGETMDTYVKRLEDLQAIADSFSGVEKSFAVQAGREERILVRPEEIDDLSATRLPRDIVKRIEEVVAKAKAEVDLIIRQAGETAAYESGVPGLPPEIIKLLGRLKYRTSYGQNVLNHSIETGRLAAVIAAEIGADVQIAKMGGLLHDIGKAVDHEVEGPHAAIGAQIAQRNNLPFKVINGIAAHHQEVEYACLEAPIVQIADAISASRPGARGETMDTYVKRLEDLQAIAESFAGVEKSFAVQAGREVRILVRPEEIDDLTATRLARDIVRKIEEQLTYPGQIKVTVIRETRAVEYAK